jgi:hypothetical protein
MGGTARKLCTMQDPRRPFNGHSVSAGAHSHIPVPCLHQGAAGAPVADELYLVGVGGHQW